jgi:spore coat-associated protein N
VVDTIETARAVDRRRRRRRGLVALLAGVALAGFGSSALSLALFTDADASTWTFDTGTIDIESSPTVLVDVTAMMPGDSDTQALTIDNDGTAELRYAMDTAATNALGDELRLEVREAGTGCANWDGAVVVADTALDGSGIGDATSGVDAGDRVLAAGSSEVLCFRVSLPLAATNSSQGATSEATFTFSAEQTANNP